MEKKSVIYFNRPGPNNTDDTISAALARARELNVSHILVASTRGETALQVQRSVQEKNMTVVCVAEHNGFAGGDKQLMPDKKRTELENLGIKVFIGSHVLSGIGRSISNTFGGVSDVELIAHTLRRFGCEGIKVAVEIAVMAADAGLIPTDQEVVTITGTGQGADTAVVLKAAHMNHFFDIEIREIIAKPRQRRTGSD